MHNYCKRLKFGDKLNEANSGLAGFKVCFLEITGFEFDGCHYLISWRFPIRKCQSKGSRLESRPSLTARFSRKKLQFIVNSGCTQALSLIFYLKLRWKALFQSLYQNKAHLPWNFLTLINSFVSSCFLTEAVYFYTIYIIFEPLNFTSFQGPKPPSNYGFLRR